MSLNTREFKRDTKLEHHISCAEIAYKSGRTAESLRHAKRALRHCTNTDKQTKRLAGKAIALRVFIARAYSKLEKYTESNKIYRALLREHIYIPPVIMGLFYNNFKTAGSEKMQLNMRLIKTCLHFH
jgi:hypothetical protein